MGNSINDSLKGANWGGWEFKGNNEAVSATNDQSTMRKTGNGSTDVTGQGWNHFVQAMADGAFNLSEEDQEKVGWALAALAVTGAIATFDAKVLDGAMKKGTKSGVSKGWHMAKQEGIITDKDGKEKWMKKSEIEKGIKSGDLIRTDDGNVVDKDYDRRPLRNSSSVMDSLDADQSPTTTHQTKYNPTPVGTPQSAPSKNGLMKTPPNSDASSIPSSNEEVKNSLLKQKENIANSSDTKVGIETVKAEIDKALKELVATKPEDITPEEFAKKSSILKSAMQSLDNADESGMIKGKGGEMRPIHIDIGKLKEAGVDTSRMTKAGKGVDLEFTGVGEKRAQIQDIDQKIGDADKSITAEKLSQTSESVRSASAVDYEGADATVQDSLKQSKSFIGKTMDAIEGARNTKGIFASLATAWGINAFFSSEAEASAAIPGANPKGGETALDGTADLLSYASLGTGIASAFGRSLLPGVGQAAAAADTASRLSHGDMLGAAMSAASGVPGFGLAAGLVQVATDAMGITGQRDQLYSTAAAAAIVQQPLSPMEQSHAISNQVAALHTQQNEIVGINNAVQLQQMSNIGLSGSTIQSVDGGVSVFKGSVATLKLPKFLNISLHNSSNYQYQAPVAN